MMILFLWSCSVSTLARPFRPRMMPNGTRLSCANCHTDPNGGGPRNPFGLDVEVIVGSSEDPFWSPTLAALDSDGDGFTNGEELGDPDGDGKPTAGATITNPGNSRSKPNRLPAAAFLRPSGTQPITQPALVNIEASATDSDGTIARVELLLGTNLVATATTAPYEFQLDTANLNAGTLDLGVRAFDNRGASSPVIRLALTLLPELRVQTAGVTAGGAFEMAWAASTGAAFVVEASTDLITWTKIGNVTAAAGAAKFAEAQPPAGGVRFYRVLLPE